MTSNSDGARSPAVTSSRRLRTAALGALIAVGPITSTNGQCEYQRLLAGTPRPADNFGKATSAAAGIIAVGAKGSDFHGTNSGAVYVFRLDGDAWSIEATLLGEQSLAGDLVGYAVSTDGEVIVAGAPYAGPFGPRSGAAYVFERVSDVWTQTQQLLPSDGDEYDLCFLAISCG